MALPLLPYLPRPVSLLAYSPHSPAVAAMFAETVHQVAPDLAAEHIGSSSVPGLAGKGIIDLQLAAPSARIPSLTEALVAAGWQRQTAAHAFPPTRPMLRAAIQFGEQTYLSHLHIIPAGDPELVETRAFRDALRADPGLRAAYVARKRQVLEEGITEGVLYAEAKGGFVVDALRSLGLRP